MLENIILAVLLLIFFLPPIITIIIGLRKKEYIKTRDILINGFSLSSFIGLIFSIIFRKQIFREIYNKEFQELGISFEIINKIFNKHLVIRYSMRLDILGKFIEYKNVNFHYEELDNKTKVNIRAKKKIHSELKTYYLAKKNN